MQELQLAIQIAEDVMKAYFSERILLLTMVSPIGFNPIDYFFVFEIRKSESLKKYNGFLPIDIGRPTALKVRCAFSGRFRFDTNNY